ncbi:MAG: TIGR00296 family protein, partial [Thermoplasmata archaeon]
RFPRLTSEELDRVTIEVSILTSPEQIEVSKATEYPKRIKIGNDGLIVEKGPYRGLLLPQVAVERKWNEEEFLSQTCMKAGLPPDAWLDKDTKIFKFNSRIFGEISPGGEVEEKTLGG